VLRCGYAVGDIVLLTAAVRDLHAGYPGKFITDARTSCAELWENNPHLTPLDETASDVTVLECDYPLINQSNQTPYHCIHGFSHFLNEHLGLAIRPTAFHGDLHLSNLEKSWYSQIHELTGEDTPFWIIAAGGKFDVTIKWWSTDRYQAVVDHFRDRIQFVQVGDLRHHHPPLDGVIDLRGKTDLRQLVRLVYHSQGILCGVTGLMHLAAAVERRDTGGHDRPCVVVAGSREPAHWEAYPSHQFVHTNGLLSCGAEGCWRSRVKPLGDGDERDSPENLCTQVVGDLPRCMEMISPEEIIRRIELYFNGGAVRPLTPSQASAARRVSRRQRSSVPPPPTARSTPASPDSPSRTADTPKKFSAPTLTLVTLADDAMAEVARRTGERLDRYARRHGYPLVRYTSPLDPSRHPAWNKVLAVRNALLSRQSDWVLWLDADAVIMNFDFPATQLIREDCDCLFASDFNGLNSGIFLARHCDWTLRFLDATYFLGDLNRDPDGFGPKWEQNTFKLLLAHFTEVSDRVVILPQRAMNSYPDDYAPGDFILHLGGMTNAERLEALSRLDTTAEVRR
jgi:ADP-heptose:LPS heptosyltransferase